MTRDYKHVSEAKQKHAKASGTSKTSEAAESLPVWFWLVSGVVIGSFVSFLVYLKLNVSVTDTKFENAKLEMPRTDSRSSEREKVKPNEETNRFEFYDILPERKMELPAKEEKETVTQEKIRSEDKLKERKKIENVSRKKEAVQRNYVLQVGSFSRFKDADKRKANLAFMGVESKIHAISKSQKTMFRVQVGPYKSLDKINEISSLLKQNNIPSLLMKVKG